MIIEWSQIAAGEDHGFIRRVDDVGDILLGVVSEEMINELGGNPLVELERSDAADALVPQYAIVKYIPRSRTDRYVAEKENILNEAIQQIYFVTGGNTNTPFGLDQLFEDERLSQESQQKLSQKLVQQNLAKFFSGPLLEITHNGIRKAELLLMMTEHREFVQDRRHKRFVLLKKVYDLTGTQEARQLDLEPIAKQLSLSGQELEHSYLYLTAEGLLKSHGAGFYIIITPEGKEFVEKRLMNTDNKDSLSVFFCYCREDERLRDKLAAHLRTLERKKIITSWHDRKITGGTEWEGKIDTHLNSSRIILMLISSDFIDSDYCCDVEMKRAAELHKSGEAVAVPVILRSCDWGDLPFGEWDNLPIGEKKLRLGNLQAFPKDAKPVTSWPNEDEAFLDIVQGIKEVIKEIEQGNSGPAAGQAIPYGKHPDNKPSPLPLDTFDKLTDIDLFVLKYVCQRFIEDDGGHTVPSDDTLEAAQQEGFSRQDVKDSIKILGERGLLTTHSFMDGKDYPDQAHPNSRGFDIYYRHTVEDYDAVVRQVGLALVNMKDGEGELSKLAQIIGRHKMLVDHILGQFERQKFIHVHRSGGGYAFVGQVSPSLKRALGT